MHTKEQVVSNLPVFNSLTSTRKCQLPPGWRRLDAIRQVIPRVESPQSPHPDNLQPVDLATCNLLILVICQALFRSCVLPFLPPKTQEEVVCLENKPTHTVIFLAKWSPTPLFENSTNGSIFCPMQIGAVGSSYNLGRKEIHSPDTPWIGQWWWGWENLATLLTCHLNVCWGKANAGWMQGTLCGWVHACVSWAHHLHPVYGLSLSCLLSRVSCRPQGGENYHLPIPNNIVFF